MSHQKEYQSFKEFWPFYLAEHRDPKCRALHYFGTLLATSTLVVLIIFKLWWFIPLVLILGYGPAWFAHFFIEKNRPATFEYPWWSFISDYKMFFYALTNQLSSELDKLEQDENL